MFGLLLLDAGCSLWPIWSLTLTVSFAALPPTPFWKHCQDAAPLFLGVQDEQTPRGAWALEGPEMGGECFSGNVYLKALVTAG